MPGHPKTCSHSNSCRQVICFIEPSIVVFVPAKKCCSYYTFKQPLYLLINYLNLIQQDKLDTGIYRSPSFFGAKLKRWCDDKREIVLENCDPEVLDIVVNYMYGIEIPDLVCCKAYLEVLTYSLSRTALSYAKSLTSQRCS